MRVSRKYAIVAIALIAVASFTPRKTYLSPAYDVTVVDNSGKVLPGLRVRRFLEYYSHGANADYSSEAITDSAGAAHFVAVTQWIGFATETFGCLSQILQTGAHASCGSYVDVSVDANTSIETARREGAVNGKSHCRSLVITRSPCPSGDWATCSEALSKKSVTTSPGNR